MIVVLLQLELLCIGNIEQYAGDLIRYCIILMTSWDLECTTIYHFMVSELMEDSSMVVLLHLARYPSINPPSFSTHFMNREHFPLHVLIVTGHLTRSLGCYVIWFVSSIFYGCEVYVGNVKTYLTTGWLCMSYTSILMCLGIGTAA